jgi:hypothetical protein
MAAASAAERVTVALGSAGISPGQGDAPVFAVTGHHHLDHAVQALKLRQDGRVLGASQAARAGGRGPLAGAEDGGGLPADAAAAPLPERAAPVVDALHQREGRRLPGARLHAQRSVRDVEDPLAAALPLELHAELQIHRLHLLRHVGLGEGPGQEALEELGRGQGGRGELGHRGDSISNAGAEFGDASGIVLRTISRSF